MDDEGVCVDGEATPQMNIPFKMIPNILHLPLPGIVKFKGDGDRPVSRSVNIAFKGSRR